ncbi:MAG: UvrD-helicase domain-containing protein [Bacteriovorax sp.]|nr:UvrD-helicase domain-containing protein [Bacteriovorax sp.]
MIPATFKKTPNEEQQNAIFHLGGKILSAGAGSGKTFVLIEHLVYLLGQIQENTTSSEWNKRISSELSKIVLMTFTKKAAGEMSVRMMKRVEEILIEYENEDSESSLIFWTLVRQNLSALNITTIHGFCHRLLRLGFWSDFPQEINLVSSIEHKDKIQKLFNQWFKENQKTLDPIFLAGSQSLLSAMIEIFSSPELRVLWNNPKLSTTADSEIDQFFLQFIDVKGYSFLFNTSIDLLTSTKEKSKKWYELIIDFNELQISNGQINSSNYMTYHDFFKTIARFPITNSKEISEDQKKTLDAIREFKSDLKELSEDLAALKDNFEIYKDWVSTISHLFNYVNSHYLEIDGFSFSDLEYYVLEGLKSPEVLVKVQESFTYFIVDEFQDTSYIQFEILKNLIGKKTEKIFCVGDKKQAIYGFRGGELQVFADCAQFLGNDNNYFLKNNFRSLHSIIEFNNSLFEKVFPLGLKYEGLDPHSVEMEAQVIPSKSISGSGEVIALRTEIVGNIADLELDQLEANVLSDHIKTLLFKDEIQTICILYRKLKPSAYLLEHLLKNEIAFAAQIKIKFADDPLINILLYLIEIQLNQNDLSKKTSSLLLLKTLLAIVEVNFLNTQLIDQFLEDLKILGLRLAFHKIIFSLGLSNSFHAQNAELIDAICRLTKEDVVAVYHLLKNDEGEDYACEMMSGEAGTNGKKRIIIMSAHASKGLEFDAVLLGGVHTNGRYNGMKNHIGKFPHSFKWKKTFEQKRFFKSPFYHLESEILTLKDFSESKRLLYVACTRAVKHLAYVDLWSIVKDAPKDLHNYDNSWIQALRLNDVNKVETSLESQGQKKLDISLIQRDPVGLLARKGESNLGLISELSVTRLATIADCPFKFYLQNICKIDPDKNETKNKFIIENEEEAGDGAEIFYSSKKRGTEVHSFLSKLFLKEIEVGDVPEKEKNKIIWAYQLADRFQQDFDAVSERMIKFSFFGQMISGTPDLVFIHKNSNPVEKLIVWDFKTGIRNAENESSYWFQLMSYAYAYGNIYKIDQNNKIELSLLYLDQLEAVTKVVTFNEITQVLFTFWKKTESLNQVNSSHCSHCEYSTICKKGEKLHF